MRTSFIATLALGAMSAGAVLAYQPSMGSGGDVYNFEARSYPALDTANYDELARRSPSFLGRLLHGGHHGGGEAAPAGRRRSLDFDFDFDDDLARRSPSFFGRLLHGGRHADAAAAGRRRSLNFDLDADAYNWESRSIDLARRSPFKGERLLHAAGRVADIASNLGRRSFEDTNDVYGLQARSAHKHHQRHHQHHHDADEHDEEHDEEEDEDEEEEEGDEDELARRSPLTPARLGLRLLFGHHNGR